MPSFPDLDVGGLEIPVDHACFMRGFQGFRDLLRDRQSFIERDWPFGDAIRERGAFDQFEDQRLLAV